MTVVAFKDCIPPTEPNRSLVAELERLLDEAKSGDLRAMAYCTIRLYGSKGTGWDGADGTRDQLAACIAMLQHRYTAALLRSDLE